MLRHHGDYGIAHFPSYISHRLSCFAAWANFFWLLCYLTLSVDMITFQKPNNIFHLATITRGLCHICVFVHPSLHVCVTLVILGSMHGDPGCKAISSLLFLPLNPFSSLCWVCYWKGFWQEGLSWKLADSRLDSWIPTFTVGVSSLAKSLNRSELRWHKVHKMRENGRYFHRYCPKYPLDTHRN